MSTPGIGDPYWYEWYVGLEQVIKMIDPDSGIVSVTFQHPDYDTIDDVVVGFSDGRGEICYQIKHNIASARPDNLTYGKLLESDKKGKSLLKAVFDGWVAAKSLGESQKMSPILYTNRQVGSNRVQRDFNEKKYRSYPINTFLSKIRELLENSNENDQIEFGEDTDLKIQWEETIDALGTSNIAEVIGFFKDFKIEDSKPSLAELEKEMISKVQKLFSCNETLATNLFSKLIFALRKWTTSTRDEARVTIETVYDALDTEADINDSQHRLIPPYPFFESRKSFSEQLVCQLDSSDKKVIFLSGSPGSGKTSMISYLQSEYNLFLLRYHTFRPISPEQHFYNIDEGLCSSENLWGTLLIQLRQNFRGRLAKYSVPVHNSLLTVEHMRSHVCRLLGILAKEEIELGKKLYVCIDGIDHAARANNRVSFLSSLPLPEEIPEGVCLLIVGQPMNLYRDQYPQWLSNKEKVDWIEMPRLNVFDISQLVNSQAPQFKDIADSLAAKIHELTDGNNLSSAFAVAEISRTATIEDAYDLLSKSSITTDVQQYYSHMWDHMKTVILQMGISTLYPESLIASPILLMNGRVNVQLLESALPYGVTSADWTMIFNNLFPLIIPCDQEYEYMLFHNDFRIFLMGIINRYREKYQQIALQLAEYILLQTEGSMPYVLGIPLLICANRKDLVPTYFTADFVINALAEGISKSRLDEYARLSYESVCLHENMNGFIDTYLAIKTLHQHTRYFEYYDRLYEEKDYPELAVIDISEIRVLPLTNKNVPEYEKTLDLCEKLFRSGRQDFIDRAGRLYELWFGNKSVYDFLPLCTDKDLVENPWYLRTDEIGILIHNWGKTAAILKIHLPHIDSPANELQGYALAEFGNSYFKHCIENNSLHCGIEALQNEYVTRACLEENLESLYEQGNVEWVYDYLPTLIQKAEESIALYAMALQITCKKDVVIDLDSIPPMNKVQRIYSDTSKAIVLRSFIHGYCEHILDDAIVCGHIAKYYDGLENEDDYQYLKQISIFACLLGKYLGSETVPSKSLRRIIGIFLKTEPKRYFDFRDAIKFLLHALFKSTISDYWCDDSDFISEVNTFLQKGVISMYYKSCILDYLNRHDKTDIIRGYILTLYGEDCKNMNLHEDKSRIHSIFEKYGRIVEPQLMQKYSNTLKWDVVGYVGRKEYAMQGLYEFFASIAKQDPWYWHKVGKKLYEQSQIACISGNDYQNDITTELVSAAISCGISDFWTLFSWNEEFYLDSNLVFQMMLGLIGNVTNLKDLLLVWILSCGFHSWYTRDERVEATQVYRACNEKAQKEGWEFSAAVANLTPQWNTIIEYITDEMFSKDGQQPYESSFKDAEEAIIEEYSDLTYAELTEKLSEIPIGSMVGRRLVLLVKRMEELKPFGVEQTEDLLKSVLAILDKKEFSHQGIDNIIDKVLDVKGEDAFWQIAQVISHEFSDYDYQISSRNMQYLLGIYLRNNIECLKQVFEKELKIHEQWITGCGHIAMDISIENQENTSLTSQSIVSLALFLLLRQLDTYNARKMEAALYALYMLGYHFPSITDAIGTEWRSLSEHQKVYILQLAVRWSVEKVDLTKLVPILIEEYNNCDHLPKLYYIHSLLLSLNMDNVCDDTVDCKATCIDCSYSSVGAINDHSDVEQFLNLMEKWGCVETNDIRRYLAVNEIHRDYPKDPYGQIGDLATKKDDLLSGRVLYRVEKEGKLESIPLSLKKSRLLQAEDPFVFSEIPQIVFDSQWFPLIEKEGLETKQLSTIVKQNIPTEEMMVAASLYYPWGHSQGVVYREVAKVCEREYLVRDQGEAWCLGNYGLLASEGALDEIECSPMSYNLFARIGGGIIINNANCQLAPTSIWREAFSCSPSKGSPNIWVDSNGNSILRFERIASPIRDVSQEHYIRQPILFRWICNKEWLQTQQKNMGLRLWFEAHSENLQD